jgi:hypothetical protein
VIASPKSACTAVLVIQWQFFLVNDLPVGKLVNLLDMKSYLHFGELFSSGKKGFNQRSTVDMARVMLKPRVNYGT